MMGVGAETEGRGAAREGGGIKRYITISDRVSGCSSH